jgi:CheY-like chemotaxis protein
MPRVLVIDDQLYVRAMITIALQAQGFDVVAVSGGRLGLSELDRSRFDLAIVDIFMPDMDGVKLMRALRQRIPDLPIVAMSGVFVGGSQRTVLDMLPMTSDLPNIMCLKKPFRAKELLDTIQKTIGAAV